MNKLIKLFMVIIAFTMITESYAQTFGVKAGLNFANMSAKDNVGKFVSDMITGIHFGLTAEFPIDEMFSFETGLILSTKGTSQIDDDGYNRDEYKEKLTYIDIPLTVKAKYDINGAMLYGIIGPYIGIGIGGQSYEDRAGTKIKWGSNKGGFDEDTFDYVEADDYKRLDFGLAIGAGVELNNVQIGMTYSLGLANISVDNSDGLKVSNSVLALSVAYKFGGK